MNDSNTCKYVTRYILCHIRAALNGYSPTCKTNKQTKRNSFLNHVHFIKKVTMI